MVPTTIPRSTNEAYEAWSKKGEEKAKEEAKAEEAEDSFARRKAEAM